LRAMPSVMKPSKRFLPGAAKQATTTRGPDDGSPTSFRALCKLLPEIYSPSMDATAAASYGLPVEAT
jgi:hypothetical protein